jgi:hypothetical protein
MGIGIRLHQHLRRTGFGGCDLHHRHQTSLKLAVKKDNNPRIEGCCLLIIHQIALADEYRLAMTINLINDDAPLHAHGRDRVLPRWGRAGQPL